MAQRRRGWTGRCWLYAVVGVLCWLALLRLAWLDEPEPNQCEMTYMYHLPEFIVSLPRPGSPLTSG